MQPEVRTKPPPPPMDTSSIKGPKACFTCAKAKARCMPRADGGDKCERCHRLGKHCFSRQPAPPRLKKRPKRSRVAELEKRLNELSEHLETQQTTTAAATTPPARPVDKARGGGGGGDVLTLEHLFPSPISTGIRTPDEATTAAHRHHHHHHHQSPWPAPDEAEALLGRYRDAFAHLFPFVVVPSGLSAADVQAETPFLWKALMLVCCLFEGARQLAMADELLSDLVVAALVDGRKTLDLLQALELLVAWFHFGLKSSQLTSLLFLARSLCVGLEASSYDEAGFRRLHHVRAFAGAYYLNTVVFTTNKRTDILMSTAQLDGYCDALASACEYPSDDYLVRLVRLQQLAHDIAIAMAPASSSSAMSLPFAMVVESFRHQLDTFRVTLPAHIAAIPTMQCNITVAEVLLLDIAISDQQCAATSLTAPERLHLLWACVRSLRAFFKLRFAMFDMDRPSFLPIIASDLTYAFITGIKLLTLQLPGWDLDRIGRELALDQMLSRQIQDLGQVIDRRANVDDDDDPRSGLEDPLERLQRLLVTGQELVALQLSGVPMQEIADTVVHEMSSTGWEGLV
ncbi:hypothetical protein XA68_13211 [Ophiocordyceps unilateralis]|uniref:Zn(2)-C6 fungal-type domain-containing protein n=1 Tax=Ophiocordyceps unilateralis TaxID=268505 RepID=A0A2A9PB96_OPHUN|nr:hypothetical protein XA68_13211 [Ophiocordyceps unilateralis]